MDKRNSRDLNKRSLPKEWYLNTEPVVAKQSVVFPQPVLSPEPVVPPQPQKQNWPKALYDASRNGDLNQVETALPKVKINEIAPNETEPCLSVATEGGHKDVVEFLIKQNADVNIVGTGGKSAIFFAVSSGHLDIAKLLTTKGANLNLIDKSGNTPLGYSIQAKHYDATRFLLEKGANVNKAGEGGMPPLSWAVCNEDIKIIKLLLKYGAKYNLHTAFLKAIECKNLTVVKFLRGEGAVVNADQISGYIPLIKAIETEHFEMVKYLVEQGASVNEQDVTGRTPLSVAASNYDLCTFDYLLKSGADISVAFKELEKISNGRMDIEFYLNQLKKDVVDSYVRTRREVNIDGSSGHEEAHSC